MISSSEEKQVSDLIDRINSAWSTGHPEQLESCFDESIVMVLPGFGGRAEGKTAVLSGFKDFCENAHIRGFEEIDRQVDVRGSVAVVSFGFDIEYEREGQAYRSTGRDLWVCEKQKQGWAAVWRTMLDLADEAVGGP